MKRKLLKSVVIRFSYKNRYTDGNGRVRPTTYENEKKQKLSDHCETILVGFGHAVVTYFLTLNPFSIMFFHNSKLQYQVQLRVYVYGY